MPNVSEFIPELLGLGVDAVICALLLKGLSVTSQTLRDLTSAGQLDIEPNIEHKIKAHDDSILDKESGTVIIPYAVIRGKVNPLGKLLRSNYPPKQVEKLQLSSL